jgi:hypothetical protein
MLSLAPENNTKSIYIKKVMKTLKVKNVGRS